MFASLLNKVFKRGTLTVIWPDGSAGTYVRPGTVRRPVYDAGLHRNAAQIR